MRDLESGTIHPSFSVSKPVPPYRTLKLQRLAHDDDDGDRHELLSPR